jgi:integrase
VKDHQSRNVAIPRVVSEELVRDRAQRKPDRLVFPICERHATSEPQFPPRRLRFGCRRPGPEHHSAHLRDTAAAPAIQAGAAVGAVAHPLGHESAATTLNHYAGLFPTDLDDAAERLGATARQTIARQPVHQGNCPEASLRANAECPRQKCPRQDSNLRHRL